MSAIASAVIVLGTGGCIAGQDGATQPLSAAPAVPVGAPAAAATPTATLAPPLPTGTATPSPVATPSPQPPTTPTPLPASPTPPRSALPDAELVRGNPSRPEIALVFNVGAGSSPALSILDTLRQKQYRATFFVMGWWADRQPDVLRRIAAEGHEIASHGHSVFDLTQATDAEVRADLEAADRAISAVTGRSTRPLWSPSAGYRDARVRRIAAEIGYRTILWTLDSGDWTREATADGVRARVRTGAANGAIVVLHFDSPTTVNSTAQALPGLIDDLRAAGYRLVTITDLLAGSE